MYRPPRVLRGGVTGGVYECEYYEWWVDQLSYIEANVLHSECACRLWTALALSPLPEYAHFLCGEAPPKK